MRLFIVLLSLPFYCLTGFQLSDSTTLFKQDSLITIDTLMIPDSTGISRSDSLARTINDSIPLADTGKIANQIIEQNKSANTISQGDSNLTSEDKNILKMPDIPIIEDFSLFTVFQIIILFFIGVGLSKLVDFMSRIKKLKEKYLYFKFFVSSVKTVIWIIILYSVLSLLIKNTDQFIFYIAVILIVLTGIATIPFIKNVIGGFYISLSVPFQSGDYIKIDNYEGEVISINLRFTLVSADNKNKVVIPNSLFLIKPVENIQRQKKEQLITIDFEFKSSVDADQVIRIIQEAALSNPYSFSRIEPKVYLVKNDSVNKKLIFQLHVYLIDAKFANNLKHSLNMIIAKKFN